MANEVKFVVKGQDQGAKKTIDDTAESVGRIGDVAKGVLAAGFIEQIGQRAQQFLGDAATAASDLQQAVGGTKAVFGAASATIDDFGRDSAEAVGLSESAFREATTLIGGQLKRMTGDVDLAAESSIQLVQVGADLAATYGGTTKEAVDAFAAALRGEADPAERFNLNLKISAVNAKAVELGLAESTDAVDDNARAQALLALVMEQSADAQGQFAREADTAAVSQQKATAAWQDAQAELGGQLLPILAQSAGIVSNLAEAWAQLPDPVKAASAAVVIISAAFLTVAPRIMAARAALIAFGLSARAANVSLGAVGVALAALSVALVGFSDSQDETKSNVQELSATLDDQTGKITDQTRELIANRLERAGLLEQAQQLDIATSDLVDAITGEEDAWKRVSRAIASGKIQFEGVDGAIALNEEGLQRLRDELEEAEDKWRRQTSAVEGTTGATEDATAANQAHLESIRALADELKAQTDPVFAWVKATQAVEEAQKAATEAEDEFGRKSPEYKAAALGLAEAQLGLVDATAGVGETSEDILPALKKLRDDGHISKEAFRALRDALRESKNAAENLDGTRVRISEERTITTTRINRTIVEQFGPNAPQVFAHGGIVGSAQGGGPRGGLTLVGEQGPELVNLAPGSMVHPAGTTQAMLSNGHGGPQHLIIDFRGVAGNPLAQAIVTAFREALRNNPTLRAEVRAA